MPKIIIPEDHQKYHQREFPLDFSAGSGIYYVVIAQALVRCLCYNLYIALGFASCYICHSALISSCIFHTNWRQCFK